MMPPENVLGSKHMATADFAPIVKRNKRKYSYSLLIVHIKLCLYVLVSNVLRFPSRWGWKGAPTKTKTKGEKVQLQRQGQSGLKGATAIFLRFLQQVVANLKSGRKIYLTLLFVLNDPLPCIWSFSSRKQILFRMHFSTVRGNPSSSAAAAFRFYPKETHCCQPQSLSLLLQIWAAGLFWNIFFVLDTSHRNVQYCFAICERKAKG